MAEDGKVKGRPIASRVYGVKGTSRIGNFVDQMSVSGKGVACPIATCECRRGLTKVNDSYFCPICRAESRMAT